MSTQLTYQQRAELCQHPLAKKLFTIMAVKKTNLGLSCDVTKKAELLALAAAIGPDICLLKTHIDIVTDFDADLVQQLLQLAAKHHFVIFEDRKFADIGNTVQQQYQQGLYHIAAWADFVNAHPLPGPGIINGLKQIGLPQGRGLLLLAEMSSADNLFTAEYTKATIAMAKQHQDFVLGFISLRKLVDEPQFIHMTPGVQLQTKQDAIGQVYRTPAKIIYENSSDVMLVGRGIYQHVDPIGSAKEYRQHGWDAYLRRLTLS